MLRIKIKHKTQQNGCFVDGRHKKKGTIECHWLFCDSYPLLELKIYSWIHISLEEANALKMGIITLTLIDLLRKRCSSLMLSTLGGFHGTDDQGDDLWWQSQNVYAPMPASNHCHGSR
jgi:hypothetical protein